MPDRNLTTVAKPAVPAQRPESYAREKEKFLAPSVEKDFYKAGTQQVPSARVVREWALAQGDIFTELVSFGKDQDHAWAHVRGWRGPKETPYQVADMPIVVWFAHELTKSVFDAMANGLWLTGEPRKYFLQREDWEIGSNGWPVVTDSAVQLQLLRNHLAKISVAERMAVTKAERAVQLKLMHRTELLGPDDDEDDQPSESVPPPPQPPKPASRSEEAPKPPETQQATFDALRLQCRDILRELCNGNKEVGEQMLLDVTGELPGDYPAVRLISEITSIHHARAVLVRLKSLQEAGSSTEAGGGPQSREELFR